MFSYRGLVVLIALCAFGAIQASQHRGRDFNRFKHWLHHGIFNSSNSLINSNVSIPSGNLSHPGHFNSSGNWSRPIRSHGPHHFNSSNVGNANSSFVPSWNYTGQWQVLAPIPGNYSNSGNFSSSFPLGFRPFRPHPGNFSNSGNFSSSFPQGQRLVPANFSTNINSSPQQRGFFNRRPSYGNFNSSRVPTVNRPVYRPVYRPAVNSTWVRPANSSWSHQG